MGWAIKIIGAITGQPTPFDGKYVMMYDPTYCASGEEYDGGILEVTEDRALALEFEDSAAAMEKWRESYGTRIDGKPNRPLTAFTVEIVQ